MSDTIEKVIAAHRAVADLLEAHPTIKPPYVINGGVIAWTLYSWDCPDGIPATIAEIRRVVGGTWTKREQESYGGQPELVLERGGYQITTKRDNVCVRRVVGTETVEHPAIAKDAWTEEREIIEWDCRPILGEAVHDDEPDAQVRSILGGVIA